MAPNNAYHRRRRPERERLLRELGPMGYPLAVLAKVTGYSEDSVTVKLSKLGAHYDGQRATSKRPPIPTARLAEYRALRDEFPEMPPSWYCEQLGIKPLPPYDIEEGDKNESARPADRGADREAGEARPLQRLHR